MKYFTLLILSIVLAALPFDGFSQDRVIKGIVTDERTSGGLPYVNIGIKGQPLGTFTDSTGFYKIELAEGDYTLMISCVGYEKDERQVHFDGKKEITLNIRLSPVMQELSTVVVSGSKYEQKVEESVSSIEVLKAKSIAYNNPTSIDKAIDKIPGITIIDNEPQIRGGSGFSSGLGSRAMIMINEIPILRGDAGRPNWSMLPVEDVDQIEVLKGASSVIYGSSAITGAVNIRTAFPKEKPETRVNTFFGVYSEPTRKYATPWTGNNPLQYGFSITNLQQISNIDLSCGFSYFNDQGYIRGAPEAGADVLYNNGEYERRGKLFVNTRVRNRKIKGLTYGLNGNLLVGSNAETFFWYDADTNIYRSYPGATSDFNKEITFFVDPYIKYYNKLGNSHSLKNRIYYGDTKTSTNQTNNYLTIYNEYQYNHKFIKVSDLTMVTGIMSTYSYSNGQIFSGKLAPDGTTSLNESSIFTSENLAVYAQFEKKFFQRLKILVGGRWEHYQITDFRDNKPIFRAGLNWQAAKKTNIRASVGQGYRAPSIGERYITTSTGNFGFYPNPDLKAESTVSYEIGTSQFFRISKFQGMIDVSGFYEDYDNYVEFNFGLWGNGSVAKSTGFKFLNTGPSVIYGVDGTITGEGRVWRDTDIALLLGYTYSVPKALEPNLVYYEQYQPSIGKVRQYSYNSTSSDTIGDIMKYRMQHVFKSDLQVTYRQRYAAGFTGRYYGYMKNIDIFFYQLDTPGAMHSGVAGYRDEHNKGNFILDFRMSYSFRAFKFSFLVNNLLNTEYSIRPVTIESPRLTSMQILWNIQ